MSCALFILLFTHLAAAEWGNRLCRERVHVEDYNIWGNRLRRERVHVEDYNVWGNRLHRERESTC